MVLVYRVKPLSDTVPRWAIFWLLLFTFYVLYFIMQSDVIDPNITLPLSHAFPATEGSGVTLNSSKVALMIEPLPFHGLVPQLLHSMMLIPPDWSVMFMGSEESSASLTANLATRHWRNSGRLNVTTTPHPWSIKDQRNIAIMMTDPDFYNRVVPQAEWLFVFNHETVLCANSEVGLDEWLGWTWAGASGDAIVDGGLVNTLPPSLRHVPAVKALLAADPQPQRSVPEFKFFESHLSVLGSSRMASKHGKYLVMGEAYIERPLGFYVPTGRPWLRSDIWNNHNTRKQMLEYCPELSMVLEMKLERERCPEKIPTDKIGQPTW